MKVTLSFKFDDATDTDIARVIGECVETMVLRNRIYLEKKPGISLYHLPLRYIEGSTAWLDIPGILRNGGGDCKDLVPWRLAEMRNKGLNASAHVLVYTGHSYHLQVRLPSGEIEDPSRLLGMKQPDSF